MNFGEDSSPLGILGGENPLFVCQDAEEGKWEVPY